MRWRMCPELTFGTHCHRHHRHHQGRVSDSEVRDGSECISNIYHVVTTMTCKIPPFPGSLSQERWMFPESRTRLSMHAVARCRWPLSVLDVDVELFFQQQQHSSPQNTCPSCRAFLQWYVRLLAVVTES
jgi:hypothetical protein